MKNIHCRFTNKPASWGANIGIKSLKRNQQTGGNPEEKFAFILMGLVC